jgi:hypothetical protein
MIHKLYGDTIEVEFKEVSHRYKVNGEFKPGVTTVLGLLHKDLMDWAVYMAVGSFSEAVAPFLADGRKMTKIALKNVADEAKKAHKNKSDKGKDVGTIVHGVIEEATQHYLNVGNWPDVVDIDKHLPEDSNVEKIAAVRNCVQNWIKWRNDYDVVPIMFERVVYSKELGYCGTMDIYFKSRRTGKTYVGDYKSSEPQKIRNSKYQITGYKAYPEHYAQCAAYDYALNEELGEEPDGYAIIYLPKEGDYQMFTREAVDDDREGWEHLFETYQWINGIKRSK